MKYLVCSFSGVYEGRKMTDGADIIDLTDIDGCGMYVDTHAEAVILSRIKDYAPGGLHFIDNGNYHYMTRLFLSFAGEEFDLVVFDHHTDDQPPAFDMLKSCGSWVYDIRRENSYLRDYLLIQNKEDVSLLKESRRPLYISVDKDVLSEEVLRTNWDQGDMTAEEFFEIFGGLIKNRLILGIDICGEDEAGKNTVMNDRFNLEVIRLLNASGVFS